MPLFRLSQKRCTAPHVTDSSLDEKRKRICFVTTLPVTLKAFVRPQTECLLQHGWEITWVCAADDNFHAEIPAGVRYHPLAFKRGVDPLGVPRAVFELYRLFKNVQFDIVQYSTPNAAFYASTAAYLARIPVRLYAQWGIRYVGFNDFARRIFKMMECWCCRCSTVIQPDSHSNLEFSISEGLYPRSKGRVIWNGSACGVDLRKFDFRQKDIWRSAYRKKLSCDNTHLIIGFAGSIRRDKGCNELIAACRSFFHNVTDARLLLIGDKHYYGTIDIELREWAESSPQVIYLPPTADVPQYMACMDIFTLASYREGFGLVIVEAEAMGVPVVVSNVPGPIDAMRDGETGFIVPVKSFCDLAVALQLLISDPVRRQAFGSAAVMFARENFEQNEYNRHVLQDKEGLL